MERSVKIKNSFVRDHAGGALIEVYVQPGAGGNEVAGYREDRLKVRLKAPPVEGKANRECVKYLAKVLSVPPSSVEIVRGHKSRMKTVLVKGGAPASVEAKLKAEGGLT